MRTFFLLLALASSLGGCGSSVPDAPLYAALSHYADALAVMLVERMPAYQAADWS